jgi:alkanesulfonate monooxygenase SsuD/methylene tetrahydromethanopterin reductase-like flavin-dependent oxidoreductase (luciferase family)
MELGYALSAEEHTPLELISNARQAEKAGFTFALVSDHFHPWIDRQGQSPFVRGSSTASPSRPRRSGSRLLFQ